MCKRFHIQICKRYHIRIDRDITKGANDISANIYDVAKLSNKSIATVSRVINKSGYVSEKTREEVMKAIETLNYNPNQIAISLTKKRTSTLGLIIPDITNPYYGELTKHIEANANKYGFQIFLCNDDEDPVKAWNYIQNMVAKKVETIIFAVPKEDDENIAKLKKAALGIPVIQIGCRNRNEENVYNVYIDYEYGAYNATEHLIELGHRKISYIGGLDISYATKKRFDGYKKALEKHGIKYEDNWVVYGTYSLEHGYNTFNKFVEDGNIPTAVLAGNDKIALGVYKAASDAKLKVGYDLSIVGSDDIDIASYLVPSLTTVKSPLDQIGDYVAKLSHDIIKNEEKVINDSLIFKPKLIVRDSTKPIA